MTSSRRYILKLVQGTFQNPVLRTYITLADKGYLRLRRGRGACRGGPGFAQPGLQRLDQQSRPRREPRYSLRLLPQQHRPVVAAGALAGRGAVGALYPAGAILDYFSGDVFVGRVGVFEAEVAGEEGRGGGIIFRF
jgi:hypothetical protein